MDLDEWEILPRDTGFMDLHEIEEDGRRKIFSGKRISSPNSLFKMNHFTYPSPPPPPPLHNSPPRTSSPRFQIVPVQIEMEAKTGKDPEAESIKEVIKVTSFDSNISPPVVVTTDKDLDLDVVAQVFFKKLKENEFVDMKTYSPKASPRGVLPQIEFTFEDRKESIEKAEDAQIEIDNGQKMIWDEEEENNNNNGGFNIWKWSLNGIGAICSFGVAAATICVIIFGNHQKINQNHKQLNFQIYAEDKRIQHVVQQGTKLNEAISAARGIPMKRAQITVGGYYDAI